VAGHCSDLETARIYGAIRGDRKLEQAIGKSLRNDLWIAALCLQYDVDLLTKDYGFHLVPKLRVLSW
jgi:predicted nucleic acid-binding protein